MDFRLTDDGQLHVFPSDLFIYMMFTSTTFQIKVHLPNQIKTIALLMT